MQIAATERAVMVLRDISTGQEQGTGMLRYHNCGNRDTGNNYLDSYGCHYR